MDYDQSATYIQRVEIAQRRVGRLPPPRHYTSSLQIDGSRPIEYVQAMKRWVCTEGLTTPKFTVYYMTRNLQCLLHTTIYDTMVFSPQIYLSARWHYKLLDTVPEYY